MQPPPQPASTLRQPSLAETVTVLDQALASAGFAATGGRSAQRRYVGEVAGCPARAEVTVFPSGRDIRNQGTLDPQRVAAAGYRLTVEVTTGLRARVAVGNELPLLLGRGLPTMPSPWPEHPAVQLRAHDLTWAQRLGSDPGCAAAMTRLLHDVAFVEHRPERLQLQLHRQPPEGHGIIAPQHDSLPQLIAALDTVARTLSAPPAPIPAKARWTDHRMLLIAVISAAVFLALAVATVLLLWLSD